VGEANKSIDDLLDDARRTLQRVTPQDAAAPGLIPASYPRRAVALIIDGLVDAVITYAAVRFLTSIIAERGTNVFYAAISFVIALLLGPETKGKELVPDLVVA